MGNHVDVRAHALPLPAQVHAQRLHLNRQRLGPRIEVASRKHLVDGRVLLLQLIQPIPGPGQDIVQVVKLIVQPLLQPTGQLNAAHAGIGLHAAVPGVILPPKARQGPGAVQLLLRERLAHRGQRLKGQRLGKHDDQQQRGNQPLHLKSSLFPVEIQPSGCHRLFTAESGPPRSITPLHGQTAGASSQYFNSSGWVSMS